MAYVYVRKSVGGVFGGVRWCSLGFRLRCQARCRVALSITDVCWSFGGSCLHTCVRGEGDAISQCSCPGPRNESQRAPDVRFRSIQDSRLSDRRKWMILLAFFYSVSQ